MSAEEFRYLWVQLGKLLPITATVKLQAACTLSTSNPVCLQETAATIQADQVHLKGGAIASTAPMTQNELTANDFSYEDISNYSIADASSIGLGIDQNMLKGSKYAVARGVLKDQIANSSESKSD